MKQVLCARNQNTGAASMKDFSEPQPNQTQPPQPPPPCATTRLVLLPRYHIASAEASKSEVSPLKQARSVLAMHVGSPLVLLRD